MVQELIEAGVRVRYAVYAERKRKPKIQYCIGYSDDGDNRWQTTRTTEEPELFLRRCVRDAIDGVLGARSQFSPSFLTSSRPFPACADALVAHNMVPNTVARYGRRSHRRGYSYYRGC